jgi:hypothetical protein
VLENGVNSRSRIELKPASFTQQDDSQAMVQFGVSSDNPLDWYMTNSLRLHSRQAGKLSPNIRRGVEQEPALSISTDGHGGLAAMKRAARISTGHTAAWAPAVPLREPATSRSSEKDEAQTGKPKGSLSRALELSCL